ncbi:MAG: PorP/SprF family type IX secretion system membrane protein [Bacteroidia bacterium]|nr:PorP/SprF family type IX secretion system membrane protein [Bacteroidia bacterium]
MALLITSFSVSGQHTPYFSQYLFNPQSVNAANAGYNEVLDVSLTHRRQWLKLEGAPISTEFNIHTALKNKKMNVGGRVQNDLYGVTNNSMVSLIYSYRVFFSKTRHLSFGADVGIGQSKNDWTKIHTYTGSDPVYAAGTERYIYGKLASGIMFRDSNYSAGISIPDIFKSDRKNILSDRQFLIYGEYRFHTGLVQITPSFLLRHAKNSPLSYDLNLTGTYLEKYTLGAGYRAKDAFLLLFRAKLNYQLEIGYAYDITLSPLKTYSSNTHEILLRYVFAYPVVSTRPRS